MNPEESSGVPHAERNLRRAGSWLLALTVAFIIYASLYPFDFDLQRLRAISASDFAHSLAWRKPPRSDLIANLLFYLPFGALTSYLIPRRWGYVNRWLAAVIAGAVLSFISECLQFATRYRDPALTDWVINALSAALGSTLALTARSVGLRPALPQLRSARPDVLALILVVMWIVLHAAPFMPTAHFIWHLRNPDLLAQTVTASAVAGFFAGYLILAMALRTLLRRPSFWPMLALVVAGSLLARILFRDQHLELDELLGLALALPMIGWLARRQRRHALPWITGWAGLGLVIFAAGGPDWGPALRIHRTPEGAPSLLELTFLALGYLWLLAAFFRRARQAQKR